jgi:hypothetical protein
MMKGSKNAENSPDSNGTLYVFIGEKLREIW